MCILFSYVSKFKKPGEFKLILINNRDEFFHRPSNIASFVSADNIYATDTTPGREGGTWLGVSKHGRVGVLLNLSSKIFTNSPSNLGRGCLVPDFLNHSKGLIDYIQKLSLESKRFNPFNLVLLEKNQENLWNAAIFNNHNATLSPIETSYLAISNHLYDDPYPKTVKGQQAFKKIVEKYNNTASRSILVEKLLELLRTKQTNCNENEDNLYDDDATDVTDTIFVDYVNYGTRTHTIILVDDNNKVYYNEHTLSFPIDGSNRNWSSQSHEFELF